MHDGSRLRIKKLARDYNPSSKIAALTAIEEAQNNGVVLTGLFYADTTKPTFVDMLNLVDEPLATLPQSRTRPPKEVLDQVMDELR